MIRIMKYGELGKDEIFARVSPTANVEDIVTGIIATVRMEGDAALRRYAKEFDKVELETLCVSE